jgi:hypothetical protein
VDATDAWALISALGAVTSTLRLGTLVSPVTFRHPSVLAKMVATADQVSGGRVELGSGAGWNEREHAAYGFDVPRRRDAVRAALRAGRDHPPAAHGGDVSFSGKHYSSTTSGRCHGRCRSPSPLILGGKAGPQARALAARFADEYNSIGAGRRSCPSGSRLDAACEEAAATRRPAGPLVMTVGIVGSHRGRGAAATRRVDGRVGADGDPAEFLAERSTAGSPAPSSRCGTGSVSSASSASAGSCSNTSSTTTSRWSLLIGEDLRAGLSALRAAFRAGIGLERKEPYVACAGHVVGGPAESLACSARSQWMAMPTRMRRPRRSAKSADEILHDDAEREHPAQVEQGRGQDGGDRRHERPPASQRARRGRDEDDAEADRLQHERHVGQAGEARARGHRPQLPRR